jgi:capsular exopolysaccharide synthesis family protein
MTETTRTMRFRADAQPSRPPPATQADNLAGLDRHLASLVAPSSFEAEQYRSLRARLEARLEASGLRLVGVTSAAVGDGKTTTAINLAGTLAQAKDHRVLLVDADVRRPSVAAQLGMGDARDPGLVDAIMDADCSLESIVRRRPPLNLAILTAGRIPHAPYEVLKSPRLGTLFEEARRDYDYVIVDTPPLIPVPDSRLIAKWIDGLLMVVAAHRTPRKLVEEGLNLVDPSKVLGLVFNGDDRPFSGYSAYYYAYGRPSGGGHRRGGPSRRNPAA